MTDNRLKLSKSQNAFRSQLICMLFCLLFVLIFSACATTPSREDLNQSEAHNKLGFGYLRNGQLNEAFVEFQKAIRVNPKNKEALNYLGYLSSEFNKHDEAISYYNRAISVDPEYSVAQNNLGVTYAKIENWNEAVKYFNAALSNPTYATPERAYSNLGYAYYMMQDYMKAEEALKEALIRNPVLYGSMYILGLVYTKTNDDNMAIKEFKRAIGIMPNYVDAHWEIANAYFRVGKRAKALKHFGMVMGKSEDTAKIREASRQIELLKYNHK